jgi:putative transposase
MIITAGRLEERPCRSERWTGFSARTTVHRELLDRVLILGEAHLRAVLAEYQAHYNTARPHQGIAQHVPADERATRPTTVTDVETQQIRRKPVLNGLINEYAPAA